MTSKQLLRKFRQRVFDYPIEEEERVARVMDYLKTRMFRDTQTYQNKSGDKYANVMWM